MPLTNKWNDDTFRKKKSEELQRRASGRPASATPYLNPDVKVFKPKTGKSITRIMDATWSGATHYGLNIWLHYGLGPNGVTVLCLKSLNQFCPVCEEVEKARRNQDEDFAKEYSAKPRVLLYLIDRENEDIGPQVWPMPKTADTKLALAAEDEVTNEILFIDDPENGYDVVIVKTVPGGVLLQTNYECKLVRQPSKLSSNPERAKQWLKHVTDHPIPSLLKYESAEHIKELMSGNVSEEESEVSSEVSSVKHEILDEPSTPSNNHVELSEDSIMKMKRKDLMALVSSKNLSIDPDNFDSTQDLAEQVVMELGLS